MAETNDYLRRPHSHDPASEHEIEQFLKKTDKVPGAPSKTTFWPLGKSYLTVTTNANNASTIKCDRVFRTCAPIVDILKAAAPKLQPGSVAAEGLAEYAETIASKASVKEFVLTMAPFASRGQLAGDAAKQFETILRKKMGTEEPSDELMVAFLNRDDSRLTAADKKKFHAIVADFKREFVQTPSQELYWIIGFILPKAEAIRFFDIGSRLERLQGIAKGLPDSAQEVGKELGLLRAKIAAGKEVSLTKEEITILENLLGALDAHPEEAKDVASFLVYTSSESFKKHATKALKELLGPLPKNDDSVQMVQELVKLRHLEAGPLADALKLVVIGRVADATKKLTNLRLAAPLTSQQVGQLLQLLTLAAKHDALMPHLTKTIRDNVAPIVAQMTLTQRAELPALKGARGLDDRARQQMGEAIDLLQEAVKLPHDPIEIIGALTEKMEWRAAIYSRVEIQKILSKPIVSSLEAKQACDILIKALKLALQREESGETAQAISQFLLSRKSLHAFISQADLQALLQLSHGAIAPARMQAAQNIKKLGEPLQMLAALRETRDARAIQELLPRLAEGLEMNRATAALLVSVALANRAAAEPILGFMMERETLAKMISRDEFRALLDAMPARENLLQQINPFMGLEVYAARMGLAHDEVNGEKIKALLGKMKERELQKSDVEHIVEAGKVLIQNDIDGEALRDVVKFLGSMPTGLLSKETLQPLLDGLEVRVSAEQGVAIPPAVLSAQQQLLGLFQKL